MIETVLILGGTEEAVRRAENLVSQNPDWRIITSLAGRTQKPNPVAGETRTGGFGGVEGLVEYIRSQKVTRLIDCTHPFATAMTVNAREAAQITGIPLESASRAPWTRQPGDEWIDVPDLEAACNAVPDGARVLLAVGRQHVGRFTHIKKRAWCFARSVDGPPHDMPLPVHAWHVTRPSPDPAVEAEFMRQLGITHLVCRNSGGKASYGKIIAARNLNITVIMIDRISADRMATQTR